MSVALFPLWAWVAVTVISGIALPYVYRDEIRATWLKLRSGKRQSATTMDWQEFNVLPLKYAACMWHGLPPTESSLQRPVVQEELARLRLAVKQRKLEHRSGDPYHAMLFLLGADPANDQFTKAALVQYAKAAGRELPPFLRSGSS